MTSDTSDTSLQGRPFSLIVSSVVFAAALFFGTWAFVFFIARSPASHANPSTVVGYYHQHWFRGWGTVGFYALAVIALAVFVQAVDRALRRLADGRIANDKSGHAALRALYTAFAALFVLTALGFRVVAPALALFFAHRGQVSLAHTANHWVQYGTFAVGVAFLAMAFFTGLALLFLGNFNLKVLGGLAIASCWVGFLTGAGIAVWVLVVGLWLAFHEFGHEPARHARSTATADM